MYCYLIQSQYTDAVAQTDVTCYLIQSQYADAVTQTDVTCYLIQSQYTDAVTLKCQVATGVPILKSLV